MRKALFALTALTVGICGAAAHADNVHPREGEVTVFDPDRDIQPRLLSHDSTTMETTNDMIPTRDSRTDGAPTSPLLVPEYDLKKARDKSKVKPTILDDNSNQ